ncbi:sensor histidine kinase [Dactylosporangium sp. CA-139066]|uniref:sensor histidine kinase n=1 Tax=Dactylosporangium sp. CA-139066 TaxID=3239930 RepID=UPI003D917942
MRQSIRLRLALIYGGLFLAAGVLLVALIYVLVAYSPFPTPPAAPAPPGASASPEVAAHGQQAETLRRLLVNSLVALAVMASAAICIGWVMAGRALRPVADMTATVRRISADRLDRRLAVSGPDDELKKLADTFDELLDRLQAAFTAQRRFIANASHELRTPLTLQHTLAEVALADPQADAPSLRAVLGRVLVAGRQQEHLIEALLTLARSQQGLHQRQRVDLATVTRHTLTQGGDPGLRIESALHPAATSGDRALIERLVENLLDNAVRHNVPDGWISVTTGVQSGRPTLRISNSGPVIPPAQVPMLLEPFQRLGNDRRSTSDGLGLGLSIVAAIIDAHHGALDVRPLPQGGLDVTVTFTS